MRLFSALSLPDDIKTRLEMLQVGPLGLSWRPRDNFHLTLCFFGDVSESKARDLDEQLAELVAAPFEIRLSGVGYFGRREPTALWAGVAQSGQLERLAAKCASCARRVGISVESRKFTPHVTLAYTADLPLSEAVIYQRAHGEFQTEPFWIEEFGLYSSRPSKRLNIYQEVASYPLTGPP